MKRANNSRIIVQNLKTMAVVQLNVLATGQDFAIDDSQIIEVIPINSAADSTLVYEELGRVQKIDVDETASAIASASGTVFSVTAYLSGSSGSTVTRYLSAVKCKQLIEFTSYRAIEYNNAGVELLTINVSDSLATLIAAINVSSSDFVTIAGAQTVTGAKTFSATLAASGALTVGTTLSVGTDQSFAKEVNHSVAVTTTTTAATAGGNLAIVAGQGATTGAGGVASLAGGASGAGATGNGGIASVTGGAAASTDGTGGIGKVVGGAGSGTGAGGAAQVIGGAAGATGIGGAVGLNAGAGGATSGAGGAVNIASGSSTVGASGTVTVTSGNTASGVAGDVVLTTGTGTSTTVCPVISLNKGVIRKPASSSVASGATITGVELVKGLIAATGATGNWTLPAAADITTAIGSTPAGTNFEFVFNAAAMTATNVATLVVGANMSVASAPAITGGGALTVAQDTQVTAGFRVVYDTATTCKLYRLW